MPDVQIPQALQLTMFRIKVYPTLPLFTEPFSRPEILKSAIEHCPEISTRRGSAWHVGNISFIENQIYCRVGRTRLGYSSVIDEQGNFIDTESETAPYSHVFIEAELGVCAISRNPELSYETERISNYLQKLLNEAINNIDINFEIKIETIKDPTEFISKLRSAYQVNKLWVTIKRPNPVDVNREFARPTSRVLEAIGGSESKTEWTGSSLNVQQDLVADIVHSSATTGGSAGATIKGTSTSRPVKISIKSNVARFGTAANLLIQQIFLDIQAQYRYVRGRGEDGNQ